MANRKPNGRKPPQSAPRQSGPAINLSPSGDPVVLPAEIISTFSEDRDFVTALARGLAVLLAFSDKKRRMSIAQVSLRTGIPRAAARRSLHTLSQMGFVASDDARRFFLRPKVLSFSHAYLSASPLAVLAQPILDRLSDLLRESCSLAILDGDEIVYLARSTSSRIMSATLNVGRRLPAYCTSIGRVLLAHLAETELDTYLSNAKLQAFTERTITSKDRLRQTLKTVRNAGYAIADQQMEPRICTMAVPVQDSSAAVVAGINVILQGGSISPREMVPRFLRPLQDAAQDLGAALMS